MKIETQCALWQPSTYELLDSGNQVKIERFGCNILSRPEPQALWQPGATNWPQQCSAIFTRSAQDSERGEWLLGHSTPEQWWIERPLAQKVIRLRLGLTAFKHVGIFPEQAANWDFIYQRVSENRGGEVLNIFAYTGGASLAAAVAGAQVTHVDSVKAVNIWARQNAEATSVDSIRYITEDARKFVGRELRRAKTYRGIILDPPAYGRGADGEKWVLDQHLPELLINCAKLLSPQKGTFIVLSLYSMGFSPILAHTLLNQILGEGFQISCGELFATDSFDKQLPLGIFLRAVRV